LRKLIVGIAIFSATTAGGIVWAGAAIARPADSGPVQLDRYDRGAGSYVPRPEDSNGWVCRLDGDRDCGGVWLERNGY
jgi:hypothetical protein